MAKAKGTKFETAIKSYASALKALDKEAEKLRGSRGGGHGVEKIKLLAALGDLGAIRAELKRQRYV